MMRGPVAYDDGYISRKMSQMQTQPPPVAAANGGPMPYGRQPPPQGAYMQGYPPMAPPMAGPPPMRRLPPPPPPMYYPEYDYGYGGGYDYYGGYAYPPAPMAAPPMPRMSRYEQYLEEDPELAGMSMAGPMAGPRQSARPRTPPQVPTPIKGRGDLPPSSMAEFDQRESEQKSGKAVVAAHSRDMAKEPHSRSYLTQDQPESEGERHLAKMSARYPSFSEPQMLQDHVDKMRIRLKSLAYSLDPTGPVPEIVIPDRAGGERPAIRSSTSTALESIGDSKAKHTMALEYKEMPNLSTRRSARTYPEDEYMKDNLRIKCLSHYKTTRTAADYWRPKLSNVSITDGSTTDAALPDSYASKYASKYQTKWEEPDTIYGSSSDKKPFSKPMAEICPAPEPTVERKKSKSKKTKEEPLPVEAVHMPSAPAAEEPVSISAVSESAPAEEPFDPEADEKEKKKLEKKKRKAEREAAAKAAMEAELAALAAAEAELARLEQESASLSTPAAAPAEELAAPTPVEIPTVEVQSECADDKCESSNINGGIVGVSVCSEEPPQQVTVQVVPEPVVTEELPQVVEPPTPVLVAPAPPPEEEQQPPVDSTAAAETSQ